ncbi:Uncharacterized conserved protein, DUF1330 family [Actinacidiphila yanglinensis]|uniref:Uncharacterized conserved protein, DUF1330 family n=1 Tax=Actinacidiphila yanglinensis TaxID=310779 RepID=A0A1H6BYA7_9ACTN|nr:DUF1330 domain-containing protein [Actinacidiphila yanglinensis]SEG65680.1 Uncharacterized conserved protein, DUF1330 family [Actinacidiphila yanglinensis]
MTAYAVAHMRSVRPHPEIGRYLDLVCDTLDPFGGRFLVHDSVLDVVEGSWPGHLVVIEFPDIAAAHGWYDSAAYRAILRYRTDHIDCDVVFTPGVPDGYRASSHH